MSRTEKGDGKPIVEAAGKAVSIALTATLAAFSSPTQAQALDMEACAVSSMDNDVLDGRLEKLSEPCVFAIRGANVSCSCACGCGSDGKRLPVVSDDLEEPVVPSEPEPGPESKPAPEPGPMPGPAPGPEPAPIPGPEPGPDPAPSPGPEPPIEPEPKPEPPDSDDPEAPIVPPDPSEPTDPDKPGHDASSGAHGGTESGAAGAEHEAEGSSSGSNAGKRGAASASTASQEPFAESNTLNEDALDSGIGAGASDEGASKLGEASGSAKHNPLFATKSSNYREAMSPDILMEALKSATIPIFISGGILVMMTGLANAERLGAVAGKLSKLTNLLIKPK